MWKMQIAKVERLSNGDLRVNVERECDGLTIPVTSLNYNPTTGHYWGGPRGESDLFPAGFGSQAAMQAMLRFINDSHEQSVDLFGSEEEDARQLDFEAREAAAEKRLDAALDERRALRRERLAP